LSGRGLCDELITRPEESYRLCFVVVCDLETSRMGAPYIYIYDISHLRVNQQLFIYTSVPLFISLPIILFTCSLFIYSFNIHILALFSETFRVLDYGAYIVEGLHKLLILRNIEGPMNITKLFT